MIPAESYLAGRKNDLPYTKSEILGYIRQAQLDCGEYKDKLIVTLFRLKNGEQLKAEQFISGNPDAVIIPPVLKPLAKAPKAVDADAAVGAANELGEPLAEPDDEPVAPTKKKGGKVIAHPAIPDLADDEEFDASDEPSAQAVVVKKKPDANAAKQKPAKAANVAEPVAKSVKRPDRNKPVVTPEPAPTPLGKAGLPKVAKSTAVPAPVSKQPGREPKRPVPVAQKSGGKFVRVGKVNDDEPVAKPPARLGTEGPAKPKKKR